MSLYIFTGIREPFGVEANPPKWELKFGSNALQIEVCSQRKRPSGLLPRSLLVETGNLTK